MRCVTIQLFVCFLIFLFISSCNRDRNVHDALEKMTSVPINLHLDKMQCRNKGVDTLLGDCVRPVLRIVNFVDSTECSPCKIDKMYYWNYVMGKFKKFKDKLKFVFIVAPAKMQLEEAYLSIEYCGLNSVIYVTIVR